MLHVCSLAFCYHCNKDFADGLACGWFALDLSQSAEGRCQRPGGVGGARLEGMSTQPCLWIVLYLSLSLSIYILIIILITICIYIYVYRHLYLHLYDHYHEGQDARDDGIYIHTGDVEASVP